MAIDPDVQVLLDEINARVDALRCEVSVLDFGAVGDGVTDDTAAIQAALDAVEDAGSGELVFPAERTFVVDGTFIPRVAMKVRGGGRSTVFKQKDSTTGRNVWLVTAVAGDNVVFEDFTVDLNKANTTDPGADTNGAGIYYSLGAAGGVGHAVRRVEIKNGHQVGLRVVSAQNENDPDDLNTTEVDIENVFSHHCDDDGMRIQDCTKVRITNSEASDNGDNGILASGTSRGTIIRGCVANRNAGLGIGLNYAARTQVVENEAHDNGEWGIAAGGGSDTLSQNANYVIAFNFTSGNGFSGITNDPGKSGSPHTSQPVYGVCVGNVSWENAQHGIYIQHGQHLVISANICYNNTNDGVAVNGRFGTITGNELFGNRYGLSLQGNACTVDPGYHLLGPNNIHDNTSADINDAGFVTHNHEYSPSNVSTDRTYDANSTSVAELADVVGTLISDLQELGVIA